MAVDRYIYLLTLNDDVNLKTNIWHSFQLAAKKSGDEKKEKEKEKGDK